jgi:hypothetical protein
MSGDIGEPMQVDKIVLSPKSFDQPNISNVLKTESSKDSIFKEMEGSEPKTFGADDALDNYSNDEPETPYEESIYNDQTLTIENQELYR